VQVAVHEHARHAVQLREELGRGQVRCPQPQAGIRCPKAKRREGQIGQPVRDPLEQL
jgi:hypothetical protein